MSEKSFFILSKEYSLASVERILRISKSIKAKMNSKTGRNWRMTLRRSQIVSLTIGRSRIWKAKTNVIRAGS